MTSLLFHVPWFRSTTGSDAYPRPIPLLSRHAFVSLSIRLRLSHRRIPARRLTVAPPAFFSMTYEHGLPRFVGDGRASFQTLYPRIEPFFVGNMAVSDLHTVYYELSGNPNGLPVLFVHGGPGGGTEPAHRRFFNPKGESLRPSSISVTFVFS